MQNSRQCISCVRAPDFLPLLSCLLQAPAADPAAVSKSHTSPGLAREGQELIWLCWPFQGQILPLQPIAGLRLCWWGEEERGEQFAAGWVCSVVCGHDVQHGAAHHGEQCWALC